MLPPAPDKETAERARNVLHERGWRDFTSPDELRLKSISLTHPSHSSHLVVSASRSHEACETGATSDSSISPEIEFQRHVLISKNEEAVQEHFDGFVDFVEDGVAYVTIKSREHGDELSGQYSAALLNAKGIKEKNRFLCKTVRVGEATRVDVEAVPKVVVTKEQIQEIDD